MIADHYTFGERLLSTVSCPLSKHPKTHCEALHWYSGNRGVPNLPKNEITFVDDNCPIHRARIARDRKRENCLQEPSWPVHSPDLNPIENIWAHMKRQLQCMVLDHEILEKAVVDIWNKVPADFLQNCTSQ